MNLRVDNASFGYKHGDRILNNISFEIREREVLAILGPNGVGKTTLLKCMMNMQKWTEGHTEIEGEEIENMPPQKLWKKIAYVPQAKNSALSYTTEEMVLLGRSAHISLLSQPSKKDMEIVNQAMEDVGITHLKGELCNQISGGELQMVLIARALTTKPSLLILDEPESNLDFKNQLIILDTIQRLSKESGISCIFNTHYPAHALKISSHALILSKDGKSIFGEVNEVITSNIMRNAFGVDVHISDIDINGTAHKSVITLNIV